jgi:hypothetical protein
MDAQTNREIGEAEIHTMKIIRFFSHPLTSIALSAICLGWSITALMMGNIPAFLGWGMAWASQLTLAIERWPNYWRERGLTP